MIVLDTNVVSEAMKAQPTPAVRAWLDAQVAETLYLSSITLAKMLFCINNPLSAPSLIYIKSDNFPDNGGNMRLHQTKGARSMQSHPQERIDSKSEPSPMAIVGALLAQGAIRFLDRQKRE